MNGIQSCYHFSPFLSVSIFSFYHVGGPPHLRSQPRPGLPDLYVDARMTSAQLKRFLLNEQRLYNVTDDLCQELILAHEPRNEFLKSVSDGACSFDYLDYFWFGEPLSLPGFNACHSSLFLFLLFPSKFLYLCSNYLFISLFPDLI